MKKLVILSVLVFLVSCGSGGGGGGGDSSSSDTIPDIYIGSYIYVLANGADISAFGYTATFSSTQMVINRGCKLVATVTSISGNRIYSEVTETTCADVALGYAGWDELTINGDELTALTDDGQNLLLVRI